METRERTCNAECCGNCNYCVPDDEGDWSCNNEESYAYGCKTMYDDSCDCFEDYES